MIDTSAKYWHIAEAVEALGTATTAEVTEWIQRHYPDESVVDVRSNLYHLTVNSASRPHYDKSRKNWRSDSGHLRDRLYKSSNSKPVRYELFNPAKHGHFDLQHISGSKWRVIAHEPDEQARIEDQAASVAFEQLPPIDTERDARTWAMRAVAQRRGQPVFRAKLMEAYGRRCAISDCNAVQVLEAAHIKPWKGPQTNRVDNGLLLRSDLHTLFDCCLLWINADFKVAIAPVLLDTPYAQYSGKPIRLPAAATHQPNAMYLAEHAKRCSEHANQ